MRTPDQIAVDRALLLYVLQLAEPYDRLSDVKLEQLCFLCELQTFAKGLKAFHFEFFRFAYGAFSKDLDNDLASVDQMTSPNNLWRDLEWSRGGRRIQGFDRIDDRHFRHRDR